MERSELENRFESHELSDTQRQACNNVNNMCLRMATDLVAIVPAGRQQSLMLTHLEEVKMWANKGIAENK